MIVDIILRTLFGLLVMILLLLIIELMMAIFENWKFLDVIRLIAGIMVFLPISYMVGNYIFKILM